VGREKRCDKYEAVGGDAEIVEIKKPGELITGRSYWRLNAAAEQSSDAAPLDSKGSGKQANSLPALIGDYSIKDNQVSRESV
jgi:hypothetical protein